MQKITKDSKRIFKHTYLTNLEALAYIEKRLYLRARNHDRRWLSG